MLFNKLYFVSVLKLLEYAYYRYDSLLLYAEEEEFESFCHMMDVSDFLEEALLFFLGEEHS